jgi:hypothetical protein
MTVLPAVAMAQCMNGLGHQDRQAMTCMPGTVWDAEKALCIPVASS